MSNAVKRIVSGICFGAVMLASFLLGDIAFFIVFHLLIVLMLKEFYNMTIGRDRSLVKILGISMGVLLFFVVRSIARGGNPVLFFCLLLVFLLALLCHFTFSREDGHIRYVYTLAGILYIALPFSMANFIFYSGASGCCMLMLFFIIIWAGDIGAYAVGSTLGKKYDRRLCPSVSPKKTWTGCAGGFVFAVVASLASAALLSRAGLMQVSLLHAAALAAVINVAGTLGDLCESRWKRLFGLKDSGHIIPGHGGMLDRLDSSLFAIPAGYLYLIIFSII